MEKGVVQIGKRNSKLHHQPLQRLYYSFFYYFLRVIKDLTDVEFPLRPTLTQRKRVRERENIRKLGFFLDEFLVFSRRISPKFINTLLKILSLSVVRNSMSDHSDSSPLVAPSPITDPSEIDLEAGPGEQIQCRICLETDGNCVKNFGFYVSFCTVQLVLRILIKKFRSSSSTSGSVWWNINMNLLCAFVIGNFAF